MHFVFSFCFFVWCGCGCSLSLAAKLLLQLQEVLNGVLGRVHVVLVLGHDLVCHSLLGIHLRHHAPVVCLCDGWVKALPVPFHALSRCCRQCDLLLLTGPHDRHRVLGLWQIGVRHGEPLADWGSLHEAHLPCHLHRLAVNLHQVREEPFGATTVAAAEGHGAKTKLHPVLVPLELVCEDAARLPAPESFADASNELGHLLRLVVVGVEVVYQLLSGVELDTRDRVDVLLPRKAIARLPLRLRLVATTATTLSRTVAAHLATVLANRHPCARGHFVLKLFLLFLFCLDAEVC